MTISRADTRRPPDRSTIRPEPRNVVQVTDAPGNLIIERPPISFGHGYHRLNRAGERLPQIFGNIETTKVFACLTPLNACNLSFDIQIGFIAKLKTSFKFSGDYPRARPKGEAELDAKFAS